MKTALIFGVTGQDGYYLAELLLSKGYIVYGAKRESSNLDEDLLYLTENKNLKILDADITNQQEIINLIKKINPDEIYNLAALSSVKNSFENPVQTAEINALGVLKILEAIRINKLENKTKFYEASTSEMLGKPKKSIKILDTRTELFHPKSPYGVAKIFGYYITKNYRESYNIFACNGILFNHESPRRPETFVTRKITKGVAKIKLGLQDKLVLGNLDVKRDWGHAKDYVVAMHAILQQDKPGDYIVATGKEHTLKQFVSYSFKYIGIEIVWSAQGKHTVGKDKKTNKILVEVDEKYFRPQDLTPVKADISKAKRVLKWEARISLNEIIKEMIDKDLFLLKKENNL